MSDHNSVSGEARTWTEFRWYIGGHGSYFASMGIQSVVYPYIVTFVLLEPADMVGLAQMFTMLPMFGLVLIGGMAADRRELRMHLVRLQFLSSLPMLALAAFISTDTLTFTLLVLMGMATGSVSAFVMPARDSLLNRVVKRSPNNDIQRAVTLVISIQFASQLIGIITGRFVEQTGPSLMLLILCMVLLVAAFCTTNVRPAPPGVKPLPTGDKSRLSARWRTNYLDIKEGLQEVRRSPQMFPVVILVFFAGLVLMGVYAVLFQILIRDVYQGGIAEYSTIMICFTVGVTVTTTALSRTIKIQRQGRAMLLAFLCGTAFLAVIASKPPLWMVYAMVVCWGSTAGVTISLSRSVVQFAAKESHRARIMSVYQLGFLGGGPAGTLAMGYIIDWVGPLMAARIAVIVTILVWVALCLFTELWKVSHQMADDPLP